MGPRHDRDELAAAALSVAFEQGLSRVTFGSVARYLGIADRTLVYYFPTKDDLVAQVLGDIGAELRRVLAPVVTEPVDDHRALVRAAWPVLADPVRDVLFARYVEAIGLAAAGQRPYRDLVPRLFDAWVEWAAAVIRRDSEEECRSEAEAAIALIDGLLVVRQVGGTDAADRAAVVLDVGEP